MMLERLLGTCRTAGRKPAEAKSKVNIVAYSFPLRHNEHLTLAVLGALKFFFFNADSIFLTLK